MEEGRARLVISDATRSAVAELMTQFPEQRGALLPALHLIQAELGHVAPETALEVAELFDLPPVQVLEVLRFYNLFYDTPQAQHQVAVCTNLSCSLRGARDLLRQLEVHLGIAAGSATKDGRIHLGHEECLGACANAPMMRVDEHYHEDLDVETAKGILDALE
jgi:NADH-quinone oxidoreductase subunit E